MNHQSITPPRAGIVLALALVLILIPPHLRARASSASASSAVIERGKFRFYDFKQVRGEESYELSDDGGNLIMRSQIELQMEDKISLSATLTMQPDLTPRRFETKGKKPSGSDIDSVVEITGQAATIREHNSASAATVPERFFTIASHVPLAVEMMLVRYWLKHPGQGPMRVLPGGDVSVEHRGHDDMPLISFNTSTVAQKGEVPLERYTLTGLTWGRQVLWLDKTGSLVAVIGIGGDFESTVPAVREGFESGIPFFLRRAAEDLVTGFTETAARAGIRQSDTLAISGATLIDGTGTAPVADSVVMINNDRIVFAGPRSQVSIPKGTTIVDGRGRFILPGLWDMHSHLFQAEFGPAYLAAGVTTVREMGDEFDFVTTLQKAFRQKDAPGPRMLLAGYVNGKTNAHSFDVEVETPDEVRAAVRRYKDSGFDQIKIRDHIKLETLKVIAAEAHRLGMTLVGHVPEGINALQAVEAGQDQISHINFVAAAFDFKRDPATQRFVIDLEAPKTKRAIELFKQHNTAIDPTLCYMEMYLHTKLTEIASFEPGFNSLPASYAEHLRNAAFTQGPSQSLNGIGGFLSLVGALHRARIPVVVGTDVVIPGYSVHRELELFVLAGLTPAEALQAATIVPARMMKLDKESGTVEKGKRADLIIVDANPLESISNVRKVSSVVARGRLFDCAMLRKIAGFRP